LKILFDLDGTLTDPREGIVACLRHALVAMGRECPADRELLRHIGPPLHEGFAELLACSDDQTIDAAIALYRERFATVGLFENAVYPGIVPALERLRELGATLYLATSKPLVYAERIIGHFRLTHFFHALYGAELDRTRTDKAELIAYLLERERLDPRDAYMVGDRAQDVIGARTNGVNAVGALWGFGSREELAAAGARVFCDRPEGLGAVFSHL
jgi:phosphoglycolate phosphatase